MEHPVRVAFCKILFWKNGGTFDVRGMPIRAQRQQYIRGKCSQPYDCGQCSLLQEWLASLSAAGWQWGWECDACLKETLGQDRAAGTERFVQGYYQAGRKADLSPDDPDFDPDRPQLEGCTRCGWESSFLQLVLRRLPPQASP